MNEIISTLTALCRERFEVEPVSVVALPKAGGDRRYFRMGLPEDADWPDRPASVLGAFDPDRSEAWAFADLSYIFRFKSVRVPEVYATSEDHHYYLVQDLGDVSLFSMLRSDNVEEPVAETMRELVRMQTCYTNHIETINDTAAYAPFGDMEVIWDLNYFKYEYLKNTNVVYNENFLQYEFEDIARKVSRYGMKFPAFMMRDCQSRNVMLHDGKPYFIDFQAGREGPGLYDAVSFLWQAKAGFSPEFREKMLGIYADAYVEATGVDRNELLAEVDTFVLLRTLQVLGAYGFRGLVQKRAHFIESIPGALRNLAELLAKGAINPYPELREIAAELIDDPRFRPAPADGRLHVKVFSFSYKMGYPADYSGNGGGFMFDCRGMHNPGRYEEYKQLTGLDQPVIDFLKQQGEIDDFVDKAVEMVRPTVSRYIKRGFSSLQIGFGCTGGRHRSVYSAEATAKILAALFPEAVIELCHREQGINKTFNA